MADVLVRPVEGLQLRRTVMIRSLSAALDCASQASLGGFFLNVPPRRVITGLGKEPIVSVPELII